ncbi:MAG: DUF3551 domain-containing protein [Bradyrhizobium sp.]
MRSLVSAIVVVGTLLALAPASAQTYDPNYPVCMHVYGALEGDRLDCEFTSLAQCAASAAARPATCLINPYYAYARRTPDRSYRRRRHIHR